MTYEQDKLTEIVSSYAPYDTIEAFGEGFVAYQWGRHESPYDGRKDAKGQLAAQAWDRGSEAAMRFKRWQYQEARRYEWAENPNIGSN